MDSNDIYYSDNSQLIDSNNTEWINNAVLVENEAISWHDTGPEITVDYSESSTNIDHTLNDTDGYETADPGESTESSQYFSILDATITESALDENPKCVLNVEVEKEETILPDIAANPESEIEELNLDDKISENEVILYRPAGSEELFAVQIAEDEHGNLQKYKFKVRQNDDGQFEAIPGTMEVENANGENENFEEFIEQKPCVLEESSVSEHFEYINDVENENENEETSDDMEIDYIQNILPPETQDQQEQEEEDYQTVEGVHVTGDSDDTNSRHDLSEFTTKNDDDSEEEYEVEELEEAFQDDTNDYAQQTIPVTEIRECHTNSVLQHKGNNKIPIIEPENLKQNVTIYKDDKHLSYLVIKGKEKENVLLDRKTKFNTINMRSILKCNNPSFVSSKVEKPHHSIPSIISTNIKHKPKETKQETVIPVKNKSARQPRKQSLNPVNRVGSEIIVQPLVYSLNDNDSLLIPLKHKRVVPEVLQVSDDSDPEFVLKPLTRKRKRGRPRKSHSVEITILDSDEEDEDTNSVIEVPSDRESETNERVEEITEPEEPKESKKNEVTKVSSPKKNDEPAAPKVSKVNHTPKKNKCPLCPKTFPRMITLKRHINMHNVRKSLRSTKSNIELQDKKVSATPAYNCKKCKLKFLLESQYKRHQTVHIKKQPPVIKTSPKKKLEKHVGSRYLRSNSKINESKIIPQKTQFKCEYCGQTYSTRSLLFSHRNTHKTFPCPNCKTTFTAKLLLDDHLRKNCVKSPIKARKSVAKGGVIYKKSFVKCEKCSRHFPNQKSLQIHHSVSHKRHSFTKIISDLSEKERGLLINRMPHGGVPMSLKMQQAFDKAKQKT